MFVKRPQTSTTHFPLGPRKDGEDSNSSWPIISSTRDRNLALRRQIQANICRNARTNPATQRNDARFYKESW